MNSFLLGLIGAASGIVTFGGLVGLWLRGQMEDLRDLKREVQGDIKRRIGELETFAKSHQSNCPATGIEHDLANTVGWLKKIDGKLDMFTHETREQRAQIAAQAKWIENLDSSHQHHVRDREMHRHG